MEHPIHPKPDIEQQFNQWYPAIFRYFRLRGADADAANDLASDVFERAFLQAHRFDARLGAFSTWLFTIARNTAANYWKSPVSRMETGLDAWEDVQDGNLWPEDALIALENRAEVLAALPSLDARERELIALKFASRLNNRQIAAMTGLSESNVGVILYRALHRLRAIILQKTGEVSRE